MTVSFTRKSSQNKRKGNALPWLNDECRNKDQDKDQLHKISGKSLAKIQLNEKLSNTDNTKRPKQFVWTLLKVHNGMGKNMITLATNFNISFLNSVHDITQAFIALDLTCLLLIMHSLFFNG